MSGVTAPAIPLRMPEGLRRATALRAAHDRGLLIYWQLIPDRVPKRDLYVVEVDGREIVLHAPEVLPFVWGLASCAGCGDLFTYRDPIP